MRRPRAGLIALTVFSVFGAVMSGLTAFLLAVPGTPLDIIWNANPRAQFELRQIGGWGIALMVTVCIACALTAIGIAKRARWGHRLAVVILSANLIGDTVNAIVNRDPRVLIGLPIAGAVIVYLLTRRVRAEFAPRVMSKQDPSVPPRRSL